MLFLERKHTLKLYYKPVIFVVVDTIIRHPIRLVSMLLIELILTHTWYAICTAIQKYSSAEQVMQEMSKAIVSVGVYTKVTTIMVYQKIYSYYIKWEIQARIQKAVAFLKETVNRITPAVSEKAANCMKRIEQKLDSISKDKVMQLYV